MKYFVLVSFIFLFAISNVMAQSKTETLKIKGIPYRFRFDGTPLKYSLKDSSTLAMTAGPKTDWYRDPGGKYKTHNAPALLFEPDENFVFTVKVEHSFTNKWDGGALVLKQDSLNYIKFCFEKDYMGNRRVVTVVTKDFSDDCNSEVLSANAVYYKLAKSGETIILYYSIDNIKWNLVRQTYFKPNSKIQVGILAQSPDGAFCEVKFSDFRYEKRAISDPYTLK